MATDPESTLWLHYFSLGETREKSRNIDQKMGARFLTTKGFAIVNVSFFIGLNEFSLVI